MLGAQALAHGRGGDVHRHAGEGLHAIGLQPGGGLAQEAFFAGDRDQAVFGHGHFAGFHGANLIRQQTSDFQEDVFGVLALDFQAAFLFHSAEDFIAHSVDRGEG